MRYYYKIPSLPQHRGIRVLALCLSISLLFCVGASAQNIKVSGIITDKDGEVIIGAAVEVEGADATLGTISEFDGSYSLEVASDATLIFSYLGMKTQSVPVEGRTTIDVTMAPETSILTEVVVMGYGTQERSKISGSVSVLNAEDISDTPVLRTEQALQGKTSGVQVAQNSGSPGSGLTVRIRGVSSLRGGDPLYIVDGMPVDNLDFLNPGDIESINILKDAAASIYGSRGGNGVVLITTKKGSKKEDGIIDFESYYGIQSARKKLNLLNAREYAIIQNEAHINAGQVPPAEFMNPDAFGEGTDWQGAIFENAPITNTQLSIRGGGGKSTYSLSGNYFNQEGIVGGEKAEFERVTARLNANHDVKEWLTIGTNMGITHFTRNALPENNEYSTPLVRALNMDPITPIRKWDGTYAYSKYSDTDITNPVNQISQTFDTWTSNRFLGSMFSEFKFMEGLSLKSTYSVDATFATQDIFLPIFNLSVDTTLNDAPAQERRDNNLVVYNNYRWRTWQLENVLSWNKTFNEKHSVTALLGNTVQAFREHISGGANTNLPSNDPEDALIGNTIDPLTSQTSFETAWESALLSYFGRVNYEYDEKYLLVAILRSDGSSKFGPDKRFGWFPSLSAGWVISKEGFWNADLVSFLKLRASWGKNGIDNTRADAYRAVISSGQNYSFGPEETITNGSMPIVPGNPEIHWEEITQGNIGFDVELWDGQLNITTDYFVRNTSDMLYPAPIPLTAGTPAPEQNIATMSNKGWELYVNYRERKYPFKYSFGANISLVKNKVTNLGNGSDAVLSGYVQSANSFAALTDVGHPVAAFYGYVTDGIFQNEAEIEAHAFQSDGTAPGDIRFKDLNGDGVINADDRDYIGNPTPDFTYGGTIDLEYKGFDLSIFLQGVHGNDIYNGTVRYDFSYVNRPVSVLDRWTGEGTSDSEPRVNLLDPNQNARISDRFVENGSYLRFKNVQLGYNLPKKWLNKMKFQKFRVYVASQNLLTFTKYSGLDPEIGTIGSGLEIGIDRGFYPQSRTFLGGVQVSF